MEYPFKDFDDSPRNQHHLQLLASTGLFKRTYKVDRVSSVLIRFKTPFAGSDDVTIEAEALDESIAKHEAEMWTVLGATSTKN